MAQQTISSSGKNHVFLWSVIVILLIGGLSSLGLFWGRAMRAAPQPAASQSLIHQNGCASLSSRWSPVGVRWKLTVTFKYGARAGQSQLSFMTFLPDGTLTATFPSPTPGQPDISPPAREGHWCATGPTTFAYIFKDPILQAGKMIAYVQPAINARMTSATTYIGDGVGVAYQAATGMPLGQYGVTSTTAIAV